MSVRFSVRLSKHDPAAANPLLQTCCRGLQRAGDIDRLLYCGPALSSSSVQRANAGSATLSACVES